MAWKGVGYKAKLKYVGSVSFNYGYDKTTTAQYGTVGAYIKYGNDIVTVLRGHDGPILNKRVIAGFNVSSDGVLGFGQADTNTTVYRIYNAWFE